MRPQHVIIKSSVNMNFTNLCTKQKHHCTNNTESPRPDARYQFSSSRHTKTKHVNSSLLFSFVYFVPNIRTLNGSQHRWMASQKAFSVLERHANTLLSYFFCYAWSAWHGIGHSNSSRDQKPEAQRSIVAQHVNEHCMCLRTLLACSSASYSRCELVRKSRFVFFYCRTVFRYSFVVCFCLML